MYLRRYRKPTVREALRAVREELGPDALVLATELVAAQGWRGWLGLREVQVTAGAERDVSAGRPSGPERRRADTDAVRDGVVARLTASGIDPALAEAVAQGLAPEERRGVSLPALRRGLAQELSGVVAGDETHARVEVFVGPPGVGKTTTIAKIAAQARARHGRAPGMVAADAVRAGAGEPRRVYAAGFGAPVRIARTADQ
ncbi:MAG: hypothetical protein ACHQO8_14090, partial [Vicinamibacterales bacterium]